MIAPYRLVPLWEVVQMLELQGDALLGAYANVASIAQVLLSPGTIVIRRSDILTLKGNVLYLLQKLPALELPMSAISASAAFNAITQLEVTQPPPADFTLDLQGVINLRTPLDDIRNRLRDELGAQFAFVIPYSKGQFYRPKSPHFGNEFAAKFGAECQYDLDEAAKCLALQRSTAAVYHLMRIVEAGLRAIYLCLGITVILRGRNRNWARIFEQIDRKIAEKAKAAGGGWSERQVFQELRTRIATVGDAWRNPTMHLGTKYTPEEAEEIFRAVQSLMRKISSRMDEKGQPLA